MKKLLRTENCGDCSTTILDRSQSEQDQSENMAKKEEWKILNPDRSDSQLVIRGRLDYDKIGVLRTKPGRIDSTNTNIMSCSDKIAKWICLGLGGALVSLLIEPIFISTIVIGGIDWDEESIRRGVLKRTLDWRLSNNDSSFEPKIMYSDVEIPWKNNVKEHESLLWILGEGSEVLVKGRKQGFGAKNGVWSEKSYSIVSKNNLKKLFLSVADLEAYEQKSYRDLKKLAIKYQKRKADLYNKTFKGWITSCPSIDEF
jgi:tRNA-specific adenosine deaminase 1